MDTPVPTAPVTDPAPAIVQAPPGPKPALIPLVLPPAAFTDRSKVVRAVPLAFPVTFAGRDWTSISIRRLSVAQVAAVFANFTANREIDPDFPLVLPVFVDEAGEPVPDGLLEQFDPDDADAVNEAVEVFMPRRFKGPTDPSISSSATGASTAA